MPRNQKTDVFKHINMHDGDRSVCWEWTREGSVSGRKNQERPYFQVDGTKYIAYRLVYELVYGSLDADALIRHTCDNRLCCNPEHLERGTHEENMKDMRDRQRHGLPHHTVRAIRKLAEGGDTHKQIAEKFGVARRTVTDIVNHTTYKEVRDESED